MKNQPKRDKSNSATGFNASKARMRPKVKFEKNESARSLSDQEIEKRIARGVVSNTSANIRRAKEKLKAEAKTAKMHAAAAGPVGAGPTAAYAMAPAQAIQVSDPTLERSNESAIAINPKNERNIVAGAVTFDGVQFNNSAYVSLDKGSTWQTVTAITDADEGAGIAFDDRGTCYYTSMSGGFFPCCAMSLDGGLTWSVPASFGFGDKTAVAARGQIALCGFDRVNTEACAFTLDGGMSWTVHDFTDSGLGTAPLVSYDLNYFYIIYAALDNNLKLYVSPDQGLTWNGPITIVAGNAWSGAIAGPLSYQGFALTSPGTNAAIDASGKLHVLYIDSTTSLPMYTFSSDHGSTWSAPVNIHPERATDPHMFPCLSCNKDGDLLAGTLLYDAASNKYLILRHVKTHSETAWKTFETDNGPWSAAGAPPGFRIGFGDYFDCDSFPDCGISAMAWSETPSGVQPWETWARILESMCEKPKEKCPCCVDLPDIPQECVSPAAPPWLPYGQCIVWYETRYVRQGDFLYRIIYEHRACLIGRQQGSLLFTTTLLPGETQKLYHYDRYRRTRSTTDVYSVHTSWRQSVSALHQSRVSQSTSKYESILHDVRIDGDTNITVGGMLFPVSWSIDDIDGGSFTFAQSASAQSASDEFRQTLTSASQQVDTERSIVVSTFEDREVVDVTVREIKNPNHCRAVTYFVRRVNEVYQLSTVVISVSWSLGGLRPAGNVSNVPWRSITDLRGVDENLRKLIQNAAESLPKVGDYVQAPRLITLPTDGTVYEPELAHCSSCEPAEIAEELIALEKAKAEESKLCSEAQLLELEVKRRQLLLEKGILDPFVPAQTASPAPTPVPGP